MAVRRRHRTLAFALAALAAIVAPSARPAPEPVRCQRVSLTPAGTSTEPLAQAARDLGRRLLEFNRHIEHGTLFYRRHDGSIRTGSIAAGAKDTVDLTVETQPGETIAGALHTHAQTPYSVGDPSRLSREDVEMGNQLLALPGTDRALRLYVVDVRTATMTEYAAGGRCRG